MRRLIAAAGTIALVLGVSAAFAQDAAKVERGKAVYAEQKCKMCHSIGDEGNKKGPLDEVGGKYNAEDMKAWIVDAKGMTEKHKAERKPFMKNYDKLPAEDVDALVAYMMSLKK
jgi:mono/diheme cytochrome c family protein